MQNTPTWQKLALLVLLIVVLVMNMHRSPLLLEEPRRALVAMEMLYSGNYLVPSIHGELYLNKPPFFNWLILAFYQLFGVQDWIPRAISLLSLLGMACLTFALSKREMGTENAWRAAILVPLSADILFYFSFLGEIDLFYALVSFAGFAGLYHFGRQKRWLWMYVAVYLSAAIGVLTKGLPSLVFAGLGLLVFLLWQKEWKKLFHWAHLLGILCLALPLLAYGNAYGKQADLMALLANLFLESSSRVAHEAGGVGTWLAHFLSFPISLLLATFPAGILMLMGFSRWKHVALPSLLVFTLLVMGVNLVPYWISAGTRSRYLYMFYPGFAMMAAFIWPHMKARLQGRIGQFFSILSCLPVLGITAMVLGLLPLALPPAFWPVIGLMAVVGSGSFYLHRKGRLSPFVIMLSTLIVLRGMYGFFLTESRIAESNAAQDKALGITLAQHIGDASVALDADVEGLSFTLAYYMQKHLQRIVPYASASEWVIVPRERLLTTDAPLPPFRSRDQELVLLRRKDLR